MNGCTCGDRLILLHPILSNADMVFCQLSQAGRLWGPKLFIVRTFEKDGFVQTAHRASVASAAFG